jgi:hypothetical protein
VVNGGAGRMRLKHRPRRQLVAIRNMVVAARNEVLEAARRYHALGLNIIPIAHGEKKPIIKWERYQKERVTVEQVEKWFGDPDQPVNIAIVCGSISGNFVGLDFDTVENYDRFWGDGHSKIEQETVVVNTARGVHVWCRSQQRTPKFPVEGLLDVQGEGGYILAPPSLHPSGASYKFRNPDVKTIVDFENVESVVLKRAEELGIKHHRLGMREVVQGVAEGSREINMFRLAWYLMKIVKLTPEKTLEELRTRNKNNRPPLPEADLNRAFEAAKKARKPEELDEIAEQMGWLKRVSSLVIADGRLVEEGYDGKRVYFIVYDTKTGQLTEEDTLYDDESETVYKPLMNKDVETYQVLLPTQALEYGNDEALFNEIKTFLNRWHEQPDENERVLDGLYAFETYMRDLLPQVCYRRPLGAWGKAKSTFVEVLGSICYRPFFTAGCSSEAALRRTFDLWRGTALIDEADFDKRSDLYSTMMRILNIGFDSRFGWYKCCDEQDPSQVLSFYVFGPKILANRQRFIDLALESRCQTFIAQENTTPMPLFRLKQFAEGALELRNKLLLWRFRNYNQLKDRITTTLEDPKSYDALYGEDSSVSSRIKQVTFPLSLIMSDQMRAKIRRFAEEHDALLKSLDEDRAIAEQIEAALKELVGQVAEVGQEGGAWVVPIKDIAQTIMGPAPSVDDKTGLKEYNEEVKVLCKRITKALRQTPLKLDYTGHGGRAKVKIPWAPPSTPTTQTSPTMKLGKDGDYEPELLFPYKVALKARKDAVQQDLGGLQFDKATGPAKKEGSQ